MEEAILGRMVVESFELSVSCDFLKATVGIYFFRLCVNSSYGTYLDEGYAICSLFQRTLDLWADSPYKLGEKKKKKKKKGENLMERGRKRGGEKVLVTHLMG